MRNMQSTFRRENNLSVSFRVVLKPKKKKIIIIIIIIIIIKKRENYKRLFFSFNFRSYIPGFSEQTNTERERDVPKHVPATVHSLNRRRKSIFGEQTPVHRSHGWPSIFSFLCFLHLHQIVLLRHSLPLSLSL